jgi:alkaline phosphatase D
MLFRIACLVAILSIATVDSRTSAGESAVTPERIKAAITRSIPLLEKGAAGSADQRTCFTCHNQALPIIAITEARSRGFQIDEENLARQLKHTADHLKRGQKNYLKGKGQGGRVITAGYALWALGSGGHSPDETTASVTSFLLEYQRQATHWKHPGNRPPSSGSEFATTYVALRALSDFGTKEQQTKIEARRKTVGKWLLETQPKGMEDRVFRFRALQSLSDADEAVTKARKELIGSQQEDGGWAQKSDMKSDAYATGTALVALLRDGNLAVGHSVIQGGLRYLLNTQGKDGSWHVVTRAKPFQKYFETGFPHKKDQFISIAGSSWATLALLLTLPEKPQNELSDKPIAGTGIMVGEVTSNTALVQVRLCRSNQLVKGDVPGIAGVVDFTLIAPNGVKVTQRLNATAERDFIARATFRNLQPGIRYRCETRVGSNRKSLQAGPTARFSTLPGAKGEKEVRFVVVTGMNYGKFHGDSRIDRKKHLVENNTELPKPYSGPDKHLGYPGLRSILKLKPAFFVGTGDNIYYDTPKEPRAKTLPELRQKWHEQFVQPRYRDLFAAVPTYWEIDDHDYRIDDGDNTGDYEPSPATGRRMMLEQLPVAPADDAQAKTFRTHRVSKDLQVWFTENRMYRSPNEMPDGPDKSIWGAEQKAWLKRTLLASDATFKVLISPTPMIGPDDARKIDNHTNIGGFQHERDEFFAWLKKNKLGPKKFSIICGDRHWQYHSIHPAGVEEFSCGALVDANSRLGRVPGDPKSTDPKGLIKRAYAQKVRSGGFLSVIATPTSKNTAARLAFEFYDENGKLLHKHMK